MFSRRNNSYTNAPRCYIIRLVDKYHAQGKTRNKTVNFDHTVELWVTKRRKKNITQAILHAGVCTVRENCSSKVSAPGQRTITYAQQRLLTAMSLCYCNIVYETTTLWSNVTYIFISC